MKVSLLLIVFLLLITVINVTAISIFSFVISHPCVKSLPQEYWGSSVHEWTQNRVFANSIYGFFSAVKIIISGKPKTVQEHPIPPVPSPDTQKPALSNEKKEKPKEGKNETH